MRNIEEDLYRSLANRLYSLVNEGESVNIHGQRPEAGYMVGSIAGPVFPDVTSVSVEDIIRFIKDNEEKLERYPWYYLGIWKDQQTGEVHVDISGNEGDPQNALDIAKFRKQKAIWDVANSKEIRL